MTPEQRKKHNEAVIRSQKKTRKLITVRKSTAALLDKLRGEMSYDKFISAHFGGE